jgi:hypothetical protein
LEETFLDLGFDVFIRTNVKGHHLEWEMLELARADCWNKNGCMSFDPHVKCPGDICPRF